MEVIKKRRGRPPKIKTEGKGGLDITISHSDSDSDSDTGDGHTGGKLSLDELQKQNAKDFVKREKAMTGGKVYALTEAQIKDLIK
jgi:hypothetical protein